MDSRSIGVFDSGLGGLTVVKEIRKILPNENIVYLGDTARVPYGNRGKRTLIRFALEDAKFLKAQNVKCIVIACNTASALALDQVKREVEVPVFDVVSSGSLDAANQTKTGKIGVIGTRATIESDAYKIAIRKIKPAVEVYSNPAPLLVPFIEEGEINNKAISYLLKKYLKNLKGKRLDTLILGCTHYPIISNQIEREMGRVRLINPGEELARVLYTYLSEKKLASNNKVKGKVKYFVTDLTSRFVKTAEMFLGEKINRRAREINLS